MEAFLETRKERTVIHLELLLNDGISEHHYYGSIANMYEYFDAETLGITYGALRNYGLSAQKPYQNKKCIIRKGMLLQKRGNRGISKKS